MLLNIFKVVGIGCLIFTGFIILLSKSGIATEMRDEEGNFKKKISWKVLIGGFAILLELFGLLFIENV